MVDRLERNWGTIAPKLLADLIVVTHACFAAFVVLGLVATLLGIALRWNWVRNFWFRIIHLSAIGFVILESIVGIDCPLTVWENRLREAAGQAGYPGDFIGYWAHRLLFFDAEPWIFTVSYIVSVPRTPPLLTSPQNPVRLGGGFTEPSVSASLNATSTGEG